MGWNIAPPKPKITVASKKTGSKKPSVPKPKTGSSSGQVRVPVADLMGPAPTAAGRASAQASNPKPRTAQEIAANFGYALAFLQSEPELWALVQKIQREERQGRVWDEAQIDAAIKSTKWYRTTSLTARMAQAQAKADPATFKLTVDQTAATVMDLAVSMGGSIPLATARKIAHDAVMNGWNESQMRDRLAKTVDYVKGTKHFGGQAGTDEMTLRQIARAYGQSVSDQVVKTWVSGIARGDMTVESFRADMLSRAEKQYPMYADKLRGGLTLDDIADPYIRMMASELELSEGTLDFNDPKVQSAMSSGMGMTEFRLALRNDPRWQRTKKAYDAYSEVARKVVNDFGFTA